jgi:uncharacterized Zn-binding protein involved in type VI secretion
MPAAALDSGASSVTCTDGAQGSSCARGKYNWNSGITSASNAGSSDVIINGKGAVRAGDPMASHPDGEPCVASPVDHTPTLSSFSSTVFVNGRGIGRVGDVYNGGTGFSHIIASGSGSVFCG